jgi:hypothetical protein
VALARTSSSNRLERIGLSICYSFYRRSESGRENIFVGRGKGDKGQGLGRKEQGRLPGSDAYLRYMHREIRMELAYVQTLLATI